MRGDAPEVFRCHLQFDLLVELGVGVESLGRFEGNLVVFVDHVFHDDQFGKCSDVAIFSVDLASQFPSGADGPLGCGEQGILDGADQDLAVEPLFTLPVLHAG